MSSHSNLRKSSNLLIVLVEVVEDSVPQWSERRASSTSRCRWRRWNDFNRQWARSLRNSWASHSAPHITTSASGPHQAVCQLYLHVLCVHVDCVRDGHRAWPRPWHGQVSTVARHCARQSSVYSVGVWDVRGDRHLFDVCDDHCALLSQTQVTNSCPTIIFYPCWFWFWQSLFDFPFIIHTCR